MIKNPNTKNRLFSFFLSLTLLYALLIFYLSSLSNPGDPAAIMHFLNLDKLEKLVHHSSLAFLLTPIYIFAEYPDKSAHMFLYAGFGFLLYFTLKNSSSPVFRDNVSLFAIILGLAYGATDEFHQAFVPGRTATIWDLLADVLGIILAQVLIVINRQLFASRKKITSSTLDLKLAIIFIVLSILFILIPPFNQTFLRILFALPLLLFLPGYLFILAMFPRRGELSTIERFTLSIGLSIAITVFDGFSLNYTPWGFRPNSIVISLSIIMGILLCGAYFQRLKHNEAAYDFSFKDITTFYHTLRTKETETGPDYDPALEKMLIKTMIIAILLVSAMLVYAKVTIEPEKFTAFYILGANGKAENYPTEIHFGETSKILVGIENYEYEPVNYTLEVMLGENTLEEQHIVLNHENKWLKNVTFLPELTSSIAFTNRSKLEFLLLKDNKTYRSVHLWVNTSLDRVKFAVIPNITNGDMESNDGWIFSSNSKNITGNYNNIISRSHVYEINFTTEEAGQHGTIYQNLTTYGNARAVLSFDVRDSDSNASYFVFKQALLDGQIVWESNLGDNQSNWKHIDLPIFLSGNNTLAFRIYSKYSTNFNVTVWWDNVKLRSYRNLSQSGDIIDHNEMDVNNEIDVKFIGFYKANNLSIIKLSAENLGNKAKSFDLKPAPVLFDDIGNKYDMVNVESFSQIARTTIYPGVIRKGSIFFKTINSSANNIRLTLYINGEKYNFSFKSKPDILEEVKDVALGETINNSGFEVGLYGYQNNPRWNSKVFIAIKNTEYEEKPFKLSPAPVLVDDLGYQYDKIKVQGASEIEQTTIYPGVIRRGSIYFREIRPEAKYLKLVMFLNGEKYQFNFSAKPKVLDENYLFNNSSNNVAANANMGDTISNGEFDLRLTAYQNTPNWNSMVVIAARNLGNEDIAFKLNPPPVLLDDLGNQYDMINRERANQILQTVILPGVTRKGNIFFTPVSISAKYLWLIIYINGEKHIFGFKAEPIILEDNGILIDTNKIEEDAAIGEAISKGGFEVTLKEFENSPGSRSKVRISVRNMENESKLLKLNTTTILLDDLGNQYEMVNVIRGDQIEQTTIFQHAQKEGNIYFEPVKNEAKYIILVLRMSSGKYVFGFEGKYNTS